jgi:hypothetical protein
LGGIVDFIKAEGYVERTLTVFMLMVILECCH